MKEKIARLFKKKIFDSLQIGAGESQRTIHGMFEVAHYEREFKGRVMATAASFFLCIDEGLEELRPGAQASFNGKAYTVAKVTPDLQGLAVIYFREEYAEQGEGEVSSDTEEKAGKVVENFLDNLKRKPSR